MGIHIYQCTDLGLTLVQILKFGAFPFKLNVRIISLWEM